MAFVLAPNKRFRRVRVGMGGQVWDELTGEYMEVPDYAGDDTTDPSTTGPGVPIIADKLPSGVIDTHANDGLPGNAPCDPNGSYPPGHRCAILQQYKDAQAVLKVVNTATGTGVKSSTGGVVPVSILPTQLTATLNQLGAQGASWVSQNASLVAFGFVGLLVLGAMSGGKGRR